MSAHEDVSMTEILTELVRHEVTLNELAKNMLASIASINKSIDEIKSDIRDNNKSHAIIHHDIEKRVRALESDSIRDKTIIGVLVFVITTATHFLFDFVKGH